MSFKEKILEYFRLFRVINIFSLSDLTDKLAQEDCYNKKILNIYGSILFISLLPDLYIMITEQSLNFKLVIPIMCLWEVISIDSKYGFAEKITFYRVICLFTAIRIKVIIITLILPTIAMLFNSADEIFDDSKYEILALSCFGFLFFGYLLIYGINLQMKLRRNGLLNLGWCRVLFTILLGLFCIFCVLLYAFLIFDLNRYHQVDNIIYSFLILLFAELCAYYLRKRRMRKA